jgi:hypothetical protein
MSQRIVAVPIVDEEIPWFDHSDTEDNPRPEPKANRISASDAMAKAPANTADHDTPDA